MVSPLTDATTTDVPTAEDRVLAVTDGIETDVSADAVVDPTDTVPGAEMNTISPDAVDSSDPTTDPIAGIETDADAVDR